jgi:spore maturation protein SpmA
MEVPVVISTAEAGILVPLTLVELRSAAGSLAAARVPVPMLEALVVSMVAEAANAGHVPGAPDIAACFAENVA